MLATPGFIQQMKTDILENRIFRYLLGDLSEEEQFALEQEFLADDEMFEQVCAAESELIDRYVRNRLASPEKHLFEKNYLASPVHRERLAFARTLVQAADSDTESKKDDFGIEPSAPWLSSLSASWRASGFRWALAAIVLLFAASSIWLLAENRRLREQMNQPSREAEFAQRIQDLETELRAQREQNDELAAELATLREEQPPTIGAPPQPDQVEQRSVVSFLLSPVLMRSGGDPQELTIPKETNAVLLKMNVEDANGRSFQATLRTVGGAQVWSRSAIKPLAQQTGSTITVSIPANKIPSSDYILTLSAINKANALEEINRYFFRVIKR